MLQGGRGVVPKFRTGECLYIRCVKEDIEDGRLLPARIAYNNASNNRSKFSKPWDVIFDHLGHGIIRLRVSDIPVGLPIEQPNPKRPIDIHDFRPVHVPLPENYAHSEIRVYRGDDQVRLSSEIVKKEFRAAISESTILLWPPRV